MVHLRGGSKEEGGGLRAEEINLRDDEGGCRLRVKVRPGGRADAIGVPHGGALKLSVTAPPERGRANAAVCALLAGRVGVPVTRISVASGHTSPLKTIQVEGLKAVEFLARLSTPNP